MSAGRKYRHHEHAEPTTSTIRAGILILGLIVIATLIATVPHLLWP
ncbi:hypothetical protein ATK74_1795 [Propionicimonas paludicola]|uniref:Uncharacterized protein n=1 Tax=Propionicimonas paludicola TaxID=185243 RepID=A0A2A9CUA3_9ACTN|nr:hypothetical protein [Propionicimonas paludicola]PFG17232.1 hypothetical protein ATK74_1795 [Propionicimonas paludicola]